MMEIDTIKEVSGLIPFGLSIFETSDVLTVKCSPGTRTYRIRTSEGIVLGDLYGIILDGWTSDHFEISGDSILVRSAIADARAFETEVLDPIQGTFVIHTHTGLPRRLYPDCGSTLPIVYCAHSRRAGSSASMMLDETEYRERFLPDRHHRLVDPVQKGGAVSWIPGTLTAHEGVARLLPNHYLDLADWTAVRFWPRPDAFAQNLSVDAAAATVAHHLQRFMRAATKEFRVGLALTAGFDSRILLAAAREFLEEIEFFTFAPGKHRVDQIMARKIANRLGLRHRVVSGVRASAAEMQAWDRAVGDTIRAPVRSIYTTVRQFDYDLILSGILGETGRGRLYRSDYATINAERPTAALVLTRMLQPLDPALLSATETWLRDVAWLPCSAVLDLAVLELFYMPLWRPAQCADIAEMMPLVNRTIQTAFMSVPPEEKSSDTLFRKSIAMLWPETLKFPINRFGDYRDPMRLLSKLTQPKRLIPALRKRLS